MIDGLLESGEWQSSQYTRTLHKSLMPKRDSLHSNRNIAEGEMGKKHNLIKAHPK